MDEQKTHCMNCNSEVPAHAAACRHCGYDGQEDLEDDWEDDFDYDAFVEDEFGDRQLSSRIRPWQQFLALFLLLVFVLGFMWPFLLL